MLRYLLLGAHTTWYSDTTIPVACAAKKLIQSRNDTLGLSL